MGLPIPENSVNFFSPFPPFTRAGEGLSGWLSECELCKPYAEMVRRTKIPTYLYYLCVKHSPAFVRLLP